ncbi:MAG: DUF5320 domain-containing protein [Spirochaetes bacterium]|nr:DUF5320 domain-containing protein [Spirochaetota bacterium]MBU0954363.1 DUF5320 domain-containing protein [Spirochaetota bacterium]
MPGFDQSGPMGQGPRTGRGMGQCGIGYRSDYGRGAGRGYRCQSLRRSGAGLGYRGRGPSPFFSSDPTSQDNRIAFEQQGLQARQAWLQAELEHTQALLKQSAGSSSTASPTKED